ncbi:hypothetical protein [Actinomadura chibensis]|uniref:Uncharacterized protein n=1 Tax=Actinomadura chibensis TaxID=392828 RepID=A0A5D0NAC7_9ACTN|nr:hypothetical protein [Actinomadura chibensis]TYB41318.1 hypothetical protein FXF69_34795 [Actinomadura chibensis]
MPANEHSRPPPRRPSARRAVRRAAEPVWWWAVLLAGYLAMVSAVSPLEIAVGAGAAAAGAAAAVAGRRALFDSAARPDDGSPSAGAAATRVAARAANGVAAGALLPGRVVADTARIAVRGASGGDWTRLSVAPAPAARGAATLLMSASPATFVGAVDPERGLLRVHRLTPGPSAFERRLRRTGLVTAPDNAAPETADSETTGRDADDQGRARDGEEG